MTKARIVEAGAADVPDILRFIKDLAKFEKLDQEVVATEEALRETLFGARKFAEVVFLEEGEERAGFALFFHNYSTFLGRPGLYLEDLYVRPERGAEATGSCCSAIWRALPLHRAVGAWNGGCSIGTKAQSSSTVRLAPSRCPSGRSTDYLATR